MKYIAVIEDDIPIGDMLEEILKKEGYGIMRAYSGTEALLLLAQKQPDLVLLDLLLDGAADYITKPFETRELLARITVQLRKQSAVVKDAVLEYDGLCLDTAAHQVTADGMSVRLTKTEFAILKLLMQNPSQVITKSRMLDLISQDTPDCMESSLKVHVSNLRRKLREIKDRDYIEAVWGIGFKMREM